MSLIERAFSLIAPHCCLACTAEGTVLCEACAATSLPSLPPACCYCSVPAADASVCPGCAVSSNVSHLWVRAPYEGIATELVHKLKFGFARQAAGVMARELTHVLPPLPADTLITNAPAVPARVRQRGFDQSALIARELARRLSLTYVPLLARTGTHRQVGASREQRLRQMKGEFRVSKPWLARGARVLLIDDVFTTGATLESAALMVRQAGAAQVDAAVFARAL